MIRETRKARSTKVVCLLQKLNVIKYPSHLPFSLAATILLAETEAFGITRQAHVRKDVRAWWQMESLDKPSSNWKTPALLISFLFCATHKQREKQTVQRRRLQQIIAEKNRRSAGRVWNRLLDLLISTHAAVITATIRSRHQQDPFPSSIIPCRLPTTYVLL